MEELKIAIECLKGEISTLHMEIGMPFDYGRSPHDKEYSEILLICEKLKIAEAKLDFATEVMDAIISNKSKE